MCIGSVMSHSEYSENIFTFLCIGLLWDHGIFDLLYMYLCKEKELQTIYLFIVILIYVSLRDSPFYICAGVWINIAFIQD